MRAWAVGLQGNLLLPWASTHPRNALSEGFRTSYVQRLGRLMYKFYNVLCAAFSLVM